MLTPIDNGGRRSGAERRTKAEEPRPLDRRSTSDRRIRDRRQMRFGWIINEDGSYQFLLDGKPYFPNKYNSSSVMMRRKNLNAALFAAALAI